MEKEFEKKKIFAYQKISKEMLPTDILERLKKEMVFDLNYKVGIESDDFFKGLAITLLEGTIYKWTQENRTIIQSIKRPTFLDWLLRRRKQITIKIDVSELLKTDKHGTEKIVIVENE